MRGEVRILLLLKKGSEKNILTVVQNLHVSTFQHRVPCLSPLCEGVPPYGVATHHEFAALSLSGPTLSSSAGIIPLLSEPDLICDIIVWWYLSTLFN